MLTFNKNFVRDYRFSFVRERGRTTSLFGAIVPAIGGLAPVAAVRGGSITGGPQHAHQEDESEECHQEPHIDGNYLVMK